MSLYDTRARKYSNKFGFLRTNSYLCSAYIEEGVMSSLAKQLTFRIMAVVLVMMAVITCCVYFTVRAYSYAFQ